jgi:zinc transport system substrate-binding protein
MLGRIGLRAAVALVAGVSAVAGLVGCGSGPKHDPSGVIHVVAGFYPLQYVAEQVGGGRVSVTNLVQPGAEPHDLELSPRKVASIVDANLVVYLAGFQPAVDLAVRQEAPDTSFDVASAVHLIDVTGSADAVAEPGAEEQETAAGNKDPHLWLDPRRLATIADALADRLAKTDPAGTSTYRQGAASLRERLGALDQAYSDTLKTCQRREIVFGHAAFAYLAERYDLRQVAITGLSPEIEPTPQRVARVAATAKEHRATTIFFETLASPKVAQIIATEVGATTAVLDPIEGLVPGSGEDYLSVMRANLGTLKLALECT